MSINDILSFYLMFLDYIYEGFLVPKFTKNEIKYMQSL